ncbi:MAG TPA: glycosyltransferase family 39 protein, partial [Chthonomonadaceae bacterium]|nr:glycosyltransferase family 39 protein [Chthonomonadaceae bacterium]
MPPLILGTLEMVALALLAGALGRRLLRWLRVEAGNGGERIALQIGLGLGALQFLPFALFALGIGHPAELRWACAALAALLLPDIRAVLMEGRQWVQDLRAPSWWQCLLIAGVSLMLASLYVRALAPPSYGDAVSYHLTAAVRFLQSGRFRYLYTLTPTNWPLGVEMLYTLLLAVSPASPVAIAPYLFGLVTLAALYFLARRLAGPSAGIAALCLLLIVDGGSYGGFWHQMTLAMQDVGLTAFTTLALLTLQRAAPDPEQEASWGRLSALFAGLAATTKLTGLWVLIAFTFVRALTGRRQGRRDYLADALRYGFLAACVVAPWYVRTWVLTGDPFYPMFPGLFHGIEFSAEGWRRFELGHMMFNTPPGLPPTPAVLRMTHLAVAAIGLLVCLLLLRATRRAAIAIPAAAVGAFLACICLGNYFNPRFLMPVLPAIMACLAERLQVTGYRLQGKTTCLRQSFPVPCSLFPVPCFQALCVLTAIVAVLYSVHAKDPSLPQAIAVATGRVSREAFLQEQMPDYAVTEYANAHLPANARILVGTFEYNLCYYRADALWPDTWLQDSIHYAPPARLDADLRRLGVGYLVLKTTFPDYCAHSYNCRVRMDTEPVALSALAQRHGIPLFAANDHTLYALDWGIKTRALATDSSF